MFLCAAGAKQLRCGWSQGSNKVYRCWVSRRLTGVRYALCLHVLSKLVDYFSESVYLLLMKLVWLSVCFNYCCLIECGCE